jgi:hypothetical protein
MRVRTVLQSLALVAAIGLLVAPLGAAAPKAPGASPKMGERPNEVRGDEITPQLKEAVERGLESLSRRQNASGGYGYGSGYGSGPNGHAGITALCGLAFMSAGNLPGRGKYGQTVSKCVDFLLGSTQETGLISSDNTHGVMYGHGFATLFLAEVYGMTQDDQVKEKLKKAVQLIERTQNNQGGWRYTPAPIDADISVSICEVMALRAARDAGIKVSKEVIDKAVEYVKKCQNGDGGFSYTLGSGGMGGSAFPRSAAGVAALYYAGVFEGKEIERGLNYLKQFVPGKGGPAGGANPAMFGHYYYGHYYGVQAMFLAGGDYWGMWYPAIRDELIRNQNKQTGGWSGEAGEDYATGMALIILQMPNRYLPVFHGKGPGA